MKKKIYKNSSGKVKSPPFSIFGLSLKAFIFIVFLIFFFSIFGLCLFRILSFNSYRFSESNESSLKRNLFLEKVKFSEFYGVPSRFSLVNFSGKGDSSKKSPFQKIKLTGLKGDLKLIPFLKANLLGEKLKIKEAEIHINAISQERFLGILDKFDAIFPIYKSYQIEELSFSTLDKNLLKLNKSEAFISREEGKSLSLSFEKGYLRLPFFAERYLKIKEGELNFDLQKEKLNFDFFLMPKNNPDLNIRFFLDQPYSFFDKNLKTFSFEASNARFSFFSPLIDDLFSQSLINVEGKIFYSPQQAKYYELNFSTNHLNLKKFDFIKSLRKFLFLNIQSDGYQANGKISVSDESIIIKDFFIQLGNSKVKGNLIIDKKQKLTGNFSLGFSHPFLQKNKNLQEIFPEADENGLHWLNFKVFGSVNKPKDTFQYLFNPPLEAK